MSILAIFEGDTLKIRVPVTNKDGTAKDMTGATVVAAASSNGTVVAATSATFTDIPGGIASVFFGAGALTEGVWVVEAEFSLDGEVQTFATAVMVNRSSLP